MVSVLSRPLLQVNDLSQSKYIPDTPPLASSFDYTSTKGIE
jgi:hypothetical protein